MSSIFLEDFLKSLREKGWTQVKIAELLGITQAHTSRLFHGAPPSIEIVLKLAEHFKVSTDEVLGRTENSEELSRRGSNSIKDCSMRGKTA